MDLKTYHFHNTSRQAKAVKVQGDFAILKPGEEREIDGVYALDADRIRNLAAGGLIVSDPAPKARKARREEAAAPAPEPVAEMTEPETGE